MTAAQAADAECEQDFINKALVRISNHAGVYGLLVVHPTHNRILYKAGFGNSTETCEKWVNSLIAFVGVAASTVRTLDYDDDLTFLRMQWRTKHIIVCPDPNREYCIIVVQDQVMRPSGTDTAADGTTTIEAALLAATTAAASEISAGTTNNANATSAAMNSS